MPRRKAKSETQSGKQPEGYVLDRFGQDTLQIWNKYSNALDEYHIRLFYYLEGLRESHDEALIKALQNSSSKSINEDSWYRLISYKYSNEALQAIPICQRMNKLVPQLVGA